MDRSLVGLQSLQPRSPANTLFNDRWLSGKLEDMDKPANEVDTHFQEFNIDRVQQELRALKKNINDHMKSMKGKLREAPTNQTEQLQNLRRELLSWGNQYLTFRTWHDKVPVLKTIQTLHDKVPGLRYLFNRPQDRDQRWVSKKMEIADTALEQMWADHYKPAVDQMKIVIPIYYQLIEIYDQEILDIDGELNKLESFRHKVDLSRTRADPLAPELRPERVQKIRSKIQELREYHTDVRRLIEKYKDYSERERPLEQLMIEVESIKADTPANTSQQTGLAEGSELGRSREKGGTQPVSKSNKPKNKSKEERKALKDERKKNSGTNTPAASNALRINQSKASPLTDTPERYYKDELKRLVEIDSYGDPSTGVMSIAHIEKQIAEEQTTLKAEKSRLERLKVQYKKMASKDSTNGEKLRDEIKDATLKVSGTAERLCRWAELETRRLKAHIESLRANWRDLGYEDGNWNLVSKYDAGTVQPKLARLERTVASLKNVGTTGQSTKGAGDPGQSRYVYGKTSV